jgi:SAM-dependent methyltransferase
MSSAPPAAEFPFTVGDPDRVRRARDVLDAAGYALPRIAELLGPEAPTVRQQLDARHRPLLLDRCAGGSPLEVLLRLFLLGDTANADEVRRAVAPSEPDDWFALGLLAAEGDRVGALAELAPGDDGLLLALPVRSRLAFSGRGDIDVVMSPRSHTTWRLAQCLIPRPGAAVLDVGCGAGLLGLLAAGRDGRLAAGDLNPHAVNVTTFNARLNRVPVDARIGDFFTPFEGQTFDRVISNPPFVLSPHLPGEEGYVQFHSAGRPADAVSELLVRSMGRFLRPGGYGQTLVNWAHVRGEDDRERVRAWVAGGGCDAWVLRIKTLDAAHYAAQWAPPHEDDAPFDAYTATFAAWKAYYERLGVEAVSYGVVTLRARPGRGNWFLLQDAPNLVGPCGAALERGFARRDWLEAADDEFLLGARLRVDPAARLVQEGRLGGGGWEGGQMELRLTEGLAAALTLDPRSVAVVYGLRGDRPLAVLLEELAQAWGRSADEVVPPALRLVRCLLEHGLVAPVPDDDAIGVVQAKHYA